MLARAMSDARRPRGVGNNRRGKIVTAGTAAPSAEARTAQAWFPVRLHTAGVGACLQEGQSRRVPRNPSAPPSGKWLYSLKLRVFTSKRGTQNIELQMELGRDAKTPRDRSRTNPLCARSTRPKKKKRRRVIEESRTGQKELVSSTVGVPILSEGGNNGGRLRRGDYQAPYVNGHMDYSPTIRQPASSSVCLIAGARTGRRLFRWTGKLLYCGPIARLVERRDPVLKEAGGFRSWDQRKEGNTARGTRSRIFNYYLDAVPSYAYARTLYKAAGRAAYPDEMADRGRTDFAKKRFRRRGKVRAIDHRAFSITTRYFDCECVEYAKADVDDVLMRVTVHNRRTRDPATHSYQPSLVPQTPGAGSAGRPQKAFAAQKGRPGGYGSHERPWDLQHRNSESSGPTCCFYVTKRSKISRGLV